jgi:glyoxylate/hydroxypyruvate reductase
MIAPKILLYSRRGTEIDEYAQLLRDAGLGEQLLICRSDEELEAMIPQAEIIFGVHLPPHIYSRAFRLLWIQSMWAGVEGLIHAPIAPEVIITRPLGVFGRYICHYVFGYLLALKIKIEKGFEQQAEHRWEHYRIELLNGLRIGIAGMGDIGREVARIARSFNMEIWGMGRNRPSNEYLDRGFDLTEIDIFTSGLDVLVIVLPSTVDTRGLYNLERLSKLQPHALLINVGRGAVIDENGLIELLEEKRIGGAVLDVFVKEPLPPEHPFWRLPNCIVTSHVGGPSLPRDITRCFLENYKLFMAGENLPGQVDRERGY